jgi:hypothetical protein
MMTTKEPHQTALVARIVVDGVELTVAQTGGSVNITRVTGRDRKQKLDITSGMQFHPDHPAAITLVKYMKSVAAMQPARCTCDYRYGYSDHAEHCHSIYVARDEGSCLDDD